LTIPGVDLAPSLSPPQQTPRDENRNLSEASGLGRREKPEADPEWLSQKLEVVEALHSKDEVEKAWALDLLDRCARKGVEEAKQMLGQHLRASAEEGPETRPEVCTEGSASSREETPFQGEGNKANQPESIYSGYSGRNAATSNSYVPLKDLKPWKTGLYAAAIAASMFAVDMYSGLVLGKLFENITPGPLVVIELSLFGMVGMAIADCVYKLRKSIVVLGIATVAFLLVRLLGLSILLGRFDGAVIIPIMGYSLVEIITVVLSTLGFVRLLRFAELRFDFAKISDIESDILDPETKKKYDMAVCGRCGARINVARERFISGFGKTEKHSCDNCGVFLRTNPFRAILHGSFECILGLMACMFGLAITTQNKPNGPASMIYLILVLGIIDGGRRMLFGISGVFKARKVL
jgi:hypothetical protein